MSMLKWILVGVLMGLTACLNPVFASESPDTGEKSASALYSLQDLYRLALKHAETIKIAEDTLGIAEKNKDRAFSLLVPGVSAFGGYRQYPRAKIEQPESYHNYGVRFDQSFTLNGRELIGYRAAKDLIRKSEFDLRTTKAIYLYGVMAAYYDVLKADKRVEIAKANVDRLEAHKDAVQLRMKMNEVPKTELYRTEAELSGAKTQWVVSKNSARLARSALARLVQLPPVFKLASPEFTDVPIAEQSVDQLKKAAFSGRSELQSQNLALDVAEKQLDITKGRYWPVVSIEGVYEGKDADPEAYAPDKYSMYVGLNIQYLLYDWGDRQAEVSQERHRLRQAELAAADLKKQISVEVEKAYYDLLTAQSAIVSLGDALKAARENYNALTQQFKYGLTDSLNVTDANTLMLESEINLLEARYQKALALSALERAKGTFLDGIVAGLRGGNDTARSSGQ